MTSARRDDADLLGNPATWILLGGCFLAAAVMVLSGHRLASAALFQAAVVAGGVAVLHFMSLPSGNHAGL